MNKKTKDFKELTRVEARNLARERMLPEFRFVEVCGINVTVANMDVALVQTERLIASGGNHYSCFLESNLLSNCSRNKNLLKIFNEADFVFPDGISITTLAKINRVSQAHRISGPSFMLKAIEYGVGKGWRHFFYGGGEGVATDLKSILEVQFPGLEVVGTYCPPFRHLTIKEEAEVKEKIETAQPHFVWVGLGGPKQEIWMDAHLGKIDVPMMLGVGAAFDFLSGRRPWSPTVAHKCGFLWVFRMVTGGRRIFFRNIRAVTIVACMIILEFIKVRLLGRIVGR